MANWTDPKRPIYVTATEVGTGTVALGKLFDEIKGSAHPNKDDVDDILEDGTDTILELSVAVGAPDQAAMDTLVADHNEEPFDVRHREEEYESNKLVAIREFAHSIGGALSGLCEETTFTYDPGTSKLESETFKRFDSQGSLLEQVDYLYEEESLGSTMFVRRIRQ